MLSTLLLIFITALFSYLTENKATEPDQLTITDGREQVRAGEVKEMWCGLWE